MAKIQIKSEKLTPFGGIFSIMEKFDSMLSPVIDSTLGQRCSSIFGYQFSIIRKSKFPQNPKRSVRFSGKGTKRSVQKRKARNTQKAETKVL